MYVEVNAGGYRNIRPRAGEEERLREIKKERRRKEVSRKVLGWRIRSHCVTRCETLLAYDSIMMVLSSID